MLLDPVRREQGPEDRLLVVKLGRIDVDRNHLDRLNVRNHVRRIIRERLGVVRDLEAVARLRCNVEPAMLAAARKRAVRCKCIRMSIELDRYSEL